MLLTRRQFKQAELLVQHAVALAKYHFDDARRMPAPLLDFGFFLMNMDRTEAAVKIYQRALEYRQAQFGGHNLKVAQAFEDLAYSLYVQEYSSGNFAVAKECSEKAITITKLLLPDNHLLLASCRRVKEEIAIDSHDKAVESALLAEADDLHLSALSLYKRVFGDNNVQTAKHYGNLGRLYQSMRRFEEAEAMHKKAIEVKQRLLGDDDYEVALSIGHLASLYNHDLDRFDEAEKLYLRSIEIERKLFGDTYSGLEYDYRGLIQVYVGLGDDNKAAEYMRRLSEWKAARDIEQAQRNPILLWNSIPTPPESTKFVMETFFKKYM
uniref:Uncharacterized protein n=1 Tax=Plectus sambesii TaxID=2011161 RepID=A0A914UHE3_9BILA